METQEVAAGAASSSRPPSSYSHESRRRPRLEAHEQLLRLLASEIAALAGFHPFKDLLELLDGHIYQDLPHLRAEDCAACGLVPVTKEQEFEQLVQQAGPQAAAAIRKIQVGSRSANVQTTGDVDKIKADMWKALKLAAAGGKVAEAGITVLRNHLTHTLSTEFGTRHEDAAIQMYESRHGVRVHSKNDKLLAWCFPQDPARVSMTRPPPVEIKPLRERQEGREAGGGEGGRGGGRGQRSSSRKEEEGVESCVVIVEDEDGNVKEEAEGSERGADPGKGIIDEPAAGVVSTMVMTESVAVEQCVEGEQAGSSMTMTVATETLLSAITMITTTSTSAPAEQQHATTMDAPTTVTSTTVTNEAAAAIVSLPIVAPFQAQPTPRPPSRPPIRGPDAWFRVCGVVDGLTEALDASHDDPGSWQMRTTVVEVKHRVAERNVRDPPPFHDTLQLLTYMLMLDGANGGGGTTWGDLVQVVRGRGGGGEGGGEGGAGGGRGEVATMMTTRVALDEGQLQHGRLFFSHVVPRLYAYTNFVYSLRHDVDARRAFLLADEDEKWESVVRTLDFWPRTRPQFNYGGGNGGGGGSNSGRARQQQRAGGGGKKKEGEGVREDSSSGGGRRGVLHEQQQSQKQKQQAILPRYYELRSQRSMVTRSNKRKSMSPLPGGGGGGGSLV